MSQVDTCVAVVASIYLTTRFPHNSTDVIRVRSWRKHLLFVRQRLDIVLGHLSHKPDTEVTYGFRSYVL